MWARLLNQGVFCIVPLFSLFILYLYLLHGSTLIMTGGDALIPYTLSIQPHLRLARGVYSLIVGGISSTFCILFIYSYFDVLYLLR